MKKFIIFFLLLALCLSLCACGKSPAVKNAEALIDGIGEVTAEKENAVLAAEEAYNALTAEEQAKVANYSTLTAARENLDKALYEKLISAISGEWINAIDADTYVFLEDGTGTHEDTAIKYTIDMENLILSVEGLTSATAKTFSIDFLSATPKLIPENSDDYYVQAENYEAISQAIRDEYTALLTSYEHWSNTQGLNYIMFSEDGGGFFLLSGTTLGMTWEWIDNNTIKLSFKYNGTSYSNVVTITETEDGPRLVNDENVVQFIPKNKR